MRLHTLSKIVFVILLKKTGIPLIFYLFKNSDSVSLQYLVIILKGEYSYGTLENVSRFDVF